MEFTLPKKPISSLLFFYFLFLFIDIGGASFIRTFSILILAFIIIKNIAKIHKITVNPFIVFTFLCYPFIALNIGILNGAEFNLAIQNISSIIFYPIIILAIFSNSDRDLIKTYSLAGLALSILIIFIFFIIKIEHSYGSTLQDILHLNFGYFGIRTLNNIPFPVVYFKSTLLLIPCFIYFIHHKKNIFALIIFISFIAANSKTAILICILTYLLNLADRINVFRLLIFTFFSIFTYFTLINNEVLTPIFNIFNDPETLNTRTGHFESFLNLISDNPHILITGQGSGTFFYSIASNSMVNNIELDHINSIRKFGIFWFSAFLSYIIWIAYLNFKNKNKYISYSVIVTFLACGTNPISISLLFFSFIAICHASILTKNSPLIPPQNQPLEKGVVA